MRPIDADMIVHWQSYDDEHETFPEHTGTIADFLDQMTDEGCPETVDAVTVRHGKWKHKKDLKQFFCDQCGEPSLTEDDVYFYGMDFPNFCPNCGADMRGDDYEAD